MLYVSKEDEWTSESIWNFSRREKFLAPAGSRTAELPAYCLVTKPTELSPLRIGYFVKAVVSTAL